MTAPLAHGAPVSLRAAAVELDGFLALSGDAAEDDSHPSMFQSKDTLVSSEYDLDGQAAKEDGHGTKQILAAFPCRFRFRHRCIFCHYGRALSIGCDAKPNPGCRSARGGALGSRRDGGCHISGQSTVIRHGRWQASDSSPQELGETVRK